MDFKITRQFLWQKLLLVSTPQSKHCLEDQILLEYLIEVLLHKVELVLTKALQKFVHFLVHYD